MTVMKCEHWKDEAVKASLFLLDIKETDCDSSRHHSPLWSCRPVYFMHFVSAYTRCCCVTICFVPDVLSV